jgi:hypothetical protein
MRRFIGTITLTLVGLIPAMRSHPAVDYSKIDYSIMPVVNKKCFLFPMGTEKFMSEIKIIKFRVRSTKVSIE